MNRTDDRIIIGAPWELSHEGYKIVGDLEKRIRHSIHKEQMQEFWRKKFAVTEEQQQSINWEAFRKTNSMNEE